MTNTNEKSLHHKLLTKYKASLHNTTLAWFTSNARNLPWRHDFQPYHIWLSEIMLQQTQMERGVVFFRRWLKRFPTIADIAKASEEEVLHYWEGLGYYSRARNLRKAAQHMVSYNNGTLPESHKDLLDLPGIGPYTASAIMSIAFNRDYPVVDGNVERLFARLFAIETPVKSPESQAILWELATNLLPKGKARLWNQALMEMGTLVCRRTTPLCENCPLTAMCQSYRQGVTALFPVPGKTSRIETIAFVAAVIFNKDKIYVQKRLTTGMWANLWEFPGGHLEKNETPEEGTKREVMEETELLIDIITPLPIVTHSFTKYRATVYSYICALSNQTTTPTLHAAQEYRWLSLAQLDGLAFSAGHRKVIAGLKAAQNDEQRGNH